MKLKRVFNEPSWVLQTKQVSAAVTRVGGHLAPVYFNRDRRAIQPYHIAPWWNEKVPAQTPPLLRVLRGDFFCAPFGHNLKPFRGEKYPLHGEPPNLPWQFIAHRRTRQGTSLHLQVKVAVRPGVVDKRVGLVNGHNVVYQQHVLSGMTGPMLVGHHPNIQFPDRPESGKIVLAPFLFGRTAPTPTGDPALGSYPFLKNNVEFHDLRRVPTIWGTLADLSVYPNYRGFCDLAFMVADPRLKFGWSSITFPRERYVWFTLKDPQVLKGTLFWRTNGGLWTGMWRGRHINCLGIEDVTWYYGGGIGDCLKPNPLSRRGITPYLTLSSTRPTAINYIQGCVPVPSGFSEVKNIEVTGADELVIHGNAGKRVRVPCATSFIHTGKLADLI
ncbi:MAG: hypothetical protein PCFJNLEI_02887 [Verrucomicrobiae bacterium]|nr:hypothetical protein [Verrucomicrobiae bacterium]